MYKEIDVFLEMLVLMKVCCGEAERAEVLDEFMRLMLENGVWCRGGDFWLMAEKFEKMREDRREQERILELNGDELGLVVFDEMKEDERDMSERRIEGLAEVLGKLKEMGKDDEWIGQSVMRIEEELAVVGILF